jgi:predicted permease
MSSVGLDIRYALRMAIKTPGLTAVLLITLALGIGASTTIFSVVSSVVLRPLPYERPDELLRIYTSLIGKVDLPRFGISTPGFDDLRRNCRSCAALGGWETGAASLSTGDRAVRIKATYATHELLPLLAVRPVLGRWFDATEDRPGHPQVIVIGHDLWQRVFAGDPHVIGTQTRLDGAPVTVIGVMPPGFSFPEHQELWVPACLDPATPNAGTSYNLSVVARPAPGASRASIAGEVAVQAKNWTATLNAVGAKLGFPHVDIVPEVVAFHADLIGSIAATLWLLQAAVLFVLLISIVNVANLLLARSETRGREVAVRHALGATRRRLIRQFLTESLMLGLAGGGLGVLAAMWAVDGVTAVIPRSAPRSDEISLDGRAVVFAVACAIVAALIFGLAPILHARRTDLHGALKDGSPRMTGNKARLRVRRALVVGELALAVVLVVGCTVMVRSFLRLQDVQLGFAPDHLLTFGVELPEAGYPPDAVDAFWHRLDARLRAIPGVARAGLIDELPPLHDKNISGFTLPGHSPGDEPLWMTDHIQGISPEALDTLGARIVRGRGLAASDDAAAPLVALVNESFAAKFFRHGDPIGQQVRLLYTSEMNFTVVGIIGDVKRSGLDQPAGAELILPIWQFPRKGIAYLDRREFGVVRTLGDPTALFPAIQRAVAELDPSVPVFQLRTMDDLMWDAVARPRFLMFLLSSFAGIALVLAAVGIYGVMAHTVAQRTHEIGLRVALGAQPAQVRAMVLRQAASLVAVGIAVGLTVAVVMSAALGGPLRELLYGDELAQPLVLIVVAVVVAATALIATWLPARRATLVEPTVALRAE